MPTNATTTELRLRITRSERDYIATLRGGNMSLVAAMDDFVTAVQAALDGSSGRELRLRIERKQMKLFMVASGL